MEYLLTMTTHVPEGTSQDAVDEIRAKEAARSRELAGQGYLLRLWRPPLQPGEWRTLGLFATVDGCELEEVLASMPLRVWRTDEITPLSPHPHDPGLASEAREKTTEFLTRFTLTVPAGTPERVFDEARAGEAERARELAKQGYLIRLWALPGQGQALGLWRAADTAELRAIVETIPLNVWLTTEITSLAEHPSDPAITRR